MSETDARSITISEPGEASVTMGCSTCPIGPSERCWDCIVFLMVSPADRWEIVVDIVKARKEQGNGQTNS